MMPCNDNALESGEVPSHLELAMQFVRMPDVFCHAAREDELVAVALVMVARARLCLRQRRERTAERSLKWANRLIELALERRAGAGG